MEKRRTKKDDGLALALMRVTRNVRGRILSVTPPVDGCGTSLAVAVLWQTSVIGRPKLKELADALHVAPPTLTPIVAGLVRGGYLIRAKDHDDARAARFTLTASGKRAYATGLRKIVASVEGMLAALTPGQRASFITLLTNLL